MDSALALALLLTSLAGLATGLGGVLVVLLRNPPPGVLGAGLGLSGGMMVYVAFMELLPSGAAMVGEPLGGPWTVTAFFAGMGVSAAIDWLVPEQDNPHDAVVGDQPALRRTGILAAIAITIHNFPEGIATFYSAMHDPTVGLSVGLAVALHNVPEGIAVALPLHRATGSRRKALAWATLSGLAEPLGAGLGYLLVGHALGEAGVGLVLATVAGIMVFLALDQLLPNAKRYGSGHESVYGLLGGMLLMALTLAWAQ
ncbi:MAG: zinc transporter ZupT [Myxococcales bacterium]|nr:zinc transporter ZupT [Myxococcales bacterium]MCB9714053.1 zinc transporter ZupT [Myxococcales bacterium]